MSDIKERSDRIRSDTEFGRHSRLTAAAFEHAKKKLGTDSTDELASKLGLANRMMLWRIRRGHYLLPYERAMDIAALLGWPHDKVFEGGTRA